MTVDHIGAIFYPEYPILRAIGRLAFPLFAYLIALGMKSTQSVTKYFTRLFIFALISQVPFSLAFGFGLFQMLNIFFTLAFGVIFIFFLHPLRHQSILCFIPAFLAFILNTDYSIYGIAVIGGMFLLRNRATLGTITIILLNLAFFFIGFFRLSQLLSLLALPIILLHSTGYIKLEKQVDAKETRWQLVKYAFYIYYPLHLTILYLIRIA